MGFIGKQPTSVPLTSSDITDGIISTAKIADDAVGNTKLDLSANYAFTGTVTGAGGMNLLLNATISSSIAGYAISSTYINSTYDEYLIFFNFTFAVDTSNLKMRVYVADSLKTASIYAYEVGNTGASNYVNSDNSDDFRLNENTIGNATGESVQGMLHLQNVNTTSFPFIYSGFCNLFNGSGTHEGQAVTGSLKVSDIANVVNGIRFNGSGNINGGTVKLYGISK